MDKIPVYNEHISSKKEELCIKSLNKSELEELAKKIREEILSAASKEGGHLSSNLGDVELTIALHRSFNLPSDKLIFDVGHQTYAHKILTGRSLEGIGNALSTSRFADTSESEYDPADAGHSSTSLSLAEGFAIARDLKGEKYDVIAVIGDASIANGLAFEALNSIGSRSNKVIVILNDNDMSISAPSGALSKFFRRISTGKVYNKMKIGYRKVLTKTKLGRSIYRLSTSFKNKVKRILIPINLFETLGFSYLGPVDGHNIKAMEKAFGRAKNSTKSTIVHVLTQKGRGYSFAERDSGAYHSVEPFDVISGQALKPNAETYPKFVGESLYEAMKENDKLVLIAAAMMKGSKIEGCFEAFPSRCFDVGIAEEHALTMASAFALSDYHPIISMYSTFLQRAYDELLHDCARKHLNMTLLIDRAGLPGKDGETHAGIYDVSFLKTIPGIKVWMPSSFKETRSLIAFSLEKGHGINAIRYPNALGSLEIDEGNEKEHIDAGFYRYKPVNDAKTVLLSVGPDGRELAKRLQNDFPGEIIIPLLLSEVTPSLLERLERAERIYVFDRYSTELGFLSSICDSLSKHHLSPDIVSFCLPNAFIPHGKKDEQAKMLGVDFDSVIRKIKETESKKKL